MSEVLDDIPSVITSDNLSWLRVYAYHNEPMSTVSHRKWMTTLLEFLSNKQLCIAWYEIITGLPYWWKLYGTCQRYIVDGNGLSNEMWRNQRFVNVSGHKTLVINKINSNNCDDQGSHEAIPVSCHIRAWLLGMRTCNTQHIIYYYHL